MKYTLVIRANGVQDFLEQLKFHTEPYDDGQGRSYDIIDEELHD